MKITLSLEEITMAAAVAVHRGVDAIRHDRKNQHGFKGNGWTENIEGYGAELSVSKALNLYYSAGDGKGFKGADVSEKIQVRWASQDNYRLIVRGADQTDYIYVLVTGEAPTYDIKGFMPGHIVKQDKYFSNPGNGRPDAWWVPQSDLKPIEFLKDYL
jgi:hypothetical protein